MQFLADESCDFAVVRSLRKADTSPRLNLTGVRLGNHFVSGAGGSRESESPEGDEFRDSQGLLDHLDVGEAGRSVPRSAGSRAEPAHPRRARRSSVGGSRSEEARPADDHASRRSYGEWQALPSREGHCGGGHISKKVRAGHGSLNGQRGLLNGEGRLNESYTTTTPVSFEGGPGGTGSSRSSR